MVFLAETGQAMQRYCEVILHALFENGDVGYCGTLAGVTESGLLAPRAGVSILQ